LAWKQWTAIADQARIANEALIETRKATEAAIEGQRARLVVNLLDPIPGFNAGQKPIARLHVRNIGSTPAYKASYETWIEVLPLPFTDFSPSADYVKVPYEMAIYPSDVSEVIAGIALQRTLSVQEVISIVQLTTHRLCFRIRLTWEDVFHKSHFANFGFSFAGGKNVESLPRYNDAD
jgi:hypothetical protein